MTVGPATARSMTPPEPLTATGYAHSFGHLIKMPARLRECASSMVQRTQSGYWWPRWQQGRTEGRKIASRGQAL